MKHLHYTDYGPDDSQWAEAALLTVWAALGDLTEDIVLIGGLVPRYICKKTSGLAAVWGWADAGEVIVVEFNGKKKETKAVADGKWMVELDSMTAKAEGGVLQVSSLKTPAAVVKVANVLIGEVWLCSGQSNMGLWVKHADRYEQEQKEASYPLIRMFTTEMAGSTKPESDCKGQWVVCSPDTVGTFSATAYFFGREIHKKLNVPVGLLLSAMGNSPIEPWIPMESLHKFEAVMADKMRMDAAVQGYDVAKAKERFEKELAHYEQEKKSGKHTSKKPPKMKQTPVQLRYYPAALYNAMIHPLIPYGIRGAIWYQGASSAGPTVERAMLYRDLLANLITSWRAAWGERFPFYFVQLPNYKSAQTQPVENSMWAFTRESFVRVMQEVPDTGMAIGIDVGMATNLHPKNKQAIGYRLAQFALNQTYGKKDVVACGPIYKSMKKEENKIIVSFDYMGSGLAAKDGAELKRFAIAGENKKFVNATAVIVGDTVVVSSPEVAKPVAVRYAWANNPEGCNLYNREGLPASPFRTDAWMTIVSQTK
ncbi:MAG: sialate O-acetylesterase [Kiritimatiellaeota bacterium]|nr:sialate O-acetylesterase [Kiritimatiellota bacterium]